MIQFDRAKALAKKRKLTLREVNDKARIGTNSIYNWKTRNPGSDAVKAVANVLGTSTDYLEGLTDDPSPASNKMSAIPIDLKFTYTYRGYIVPKKYIKVLIELMEADIKEGNAQYTVK